MNYTKFHQPTPETKLKVDSYCYIITVKIMKKIMPLLIYMHKTQLIQAVITRQCTDDGPKRCSMVDKLQ